MSQHANAGRNPRTKIERTRAIVTAEYQQGLFNLGQLTRQLEVHVPKMIAAIKERLSALETELDTMPAFTPKETEAAVPTIGLVTTEPPADPVASDVPGAGEEPKPVGGES